MKSRLSILRRARTKKPWWKTTKKPWSKFSPMATDVVCSNRAFMVTDQGFRMASIDPLPPKFFANLGCPLAPTSVDSKATEVHLVKTVKDPIEGVVVEE